MAPKKFILQRLEQLKLQGQISLDTQEDLLGFIFKSIMSKKFRKYAVNPEYIAHIRSAIKISISNNEPIKLTLVFGGYKLWRLEESPEVDWAELFSLMYYANWIKPILSAYTPGVWFDFYSDDVILELLDNVPKTDTETYIKSFKKLLEFIKAYVPDNLRFTLNRVGDQYQSYGDFKRELEQSIIKVKEELQGKLPILTPEQIALVDLNVKVKPDQAEDPQWRQKVFLIHEGYARVSKRRPYYRTPDKIFIITRPIKDSIAVGTTKTSVVKFWIGTGVLKKIGDTYIEYILSPKQLESNTFTKENINMKGLDSKNFRTIRILV